MLVSQAPVKALHPLARSSNIPPAIKLAILNCGPAFFRLLLQLISLRSVGQTSPSLAVSVALVKELALEAAQNFIECYKILSEKHGSTFASVSSGVIEHAWPLLLKEYVGMNLSHGVELSTQPVFSPDASSRIVQAIKDGIAKDNSASLDPPPTKMSSALPPVSGSDAETIYNSLLKLLGELVDGQDTTGREGDAGTPLEDVNEAPFNLSDNFMALLSDRSSSSEDYATQDQSAAPPSQSVKLSRAANLALNFGATPMVIGNNIDMTLIQACNLGISSRTYKMLCDLFRSWPKNLPLFPVPSSPDASMAPGDMSERGNIHLLLTVAGFGAGKASTSHQLASTPLLEAILHSLSQNSPTPEGGNGMTSQLIAIADAIFSRIFSVQHTRKSLLAMLTSQHCGEEETLQLSDTNVKVSSGTGSRNNLYSESNSSYWNSSGSRPHWIEVTIPEEKMWTEFAILTKNHGKEQCNVTQFFFTLRR